MSGKKIYAFGVKSGIRKKKNHTVLDTNFCGSREDPRVLVCARPRKQTAAGRPESRRSDPLQRGGGGGQERGGWGQLWGVFLIFESRKSITC